MSTPTITPAAPAAPAPSAPVSPAPSTPVSTPSTPVTSTPVAAPETSQPQTMEERLSSGWQKAKDSVKSLEETGEAVPTETETTETTVEAAPVETEAPEGETKEEVAETPAEPEEFGPIDIEDGLGPTALADFLKENPAVKEALDANPELKSGIFAALRRDSENRELRQIVPDVQTAKIMSQSAAVYSNLDGRFLKAETREGAQDFLNSWAELALIVDDKGAPALDAQGKYRFHPALENTFNTVLDNRVSVLTSEAQRTGKFPAQFMPVVDALRKFALTSGDERLETLTEVLKDYASSPQSSALEEVPEQFKGIADSLKKREDALRAQEEGVTRQRTEEQKATHEQSIERAESTAAKSVQSQLQPLFAKAGLSEFETKAALATIGEQVDQALEGNSYYQARIAQLMEQEPSEAREKEHRKLVLTYTQQYIGPIAAKVIKEAKGGTLARQQQRQDKINTQTVASRTEPKGTSIAPSQGDKVSPSQLTAQIRKEWADSHGGEPIPLDELTKETWKRTAAQRTGKV